MQVFLSEFVCGGGWNEPVLPKSLAEEGRAMLEAIVEDCSRVPGCRVITTLSADQPPLANGEVETVRVRDAEEEWAQFRKIASESDACLVIAPELNDCLTQRCAAALASGTRRLLNPDPKIVHLCSDKLKLFEHCLQHDIPTIETAPWTDDVARTCTWSPVVLKPRFGAGSQDIRVAATVEEMLSARDSSPRPVPAAAISDYIIQPLIRGTAVSVAALCNRLFGTTDILSVAGQYLSDDGRFRYLGGTVPWHGDGQPVQQLAARTLATLSGSLCGYIGFDVVIPCDHPERPVLVEINPRLTTSYLGYRRLARENLAARLLSTTPPSARIDWSVTPVTFSPCGLEQRHQQAMK